MLQTMRELAKSWVFKSLMGLLVISFGIWGIGDMFRGNPAQRTVATVGDVSIPVQLLEYRFQAGLPEAREVFGPDLTEERAIQIGVMDRTLKVMTQELTYDQDASRLGINVGKDYVLKKLANEPNLRDKDGKFNTAMWQNLLRESGMSEKGFVELESKNTARRIILSTLLANTFIPETVTNNLYQAMGDKRILEIVTLRNDSVNLDMPSPTDEALESYYKEHEASFIAPEYRGVTIARLSSANALNDIKVTDAEVEQAYQTRASEFSRPERRDLVQVVAKDEEQAKALSKAATDSKNLTDAAKKLGLSAIPMNNIDEANVLPELYTTVFALPEGEVSQPAKSALGWHVIQVKTIRQSGVPAFDVVKEEIRKLLQDERAGDVVAEAINKLDDAIAAGQPLEELANDLKLHLSRFASLDADGRKPDGSEEKDIPEKELTLPAAFDLQSGETGRVIDNGKGDYFVVRVDQVTPSAARPFDEIKDQVKKAWLAQERSVKAAAMAEEMAQEMRDGKKATSFASNAGVSVRLSKPISLLGNVDPQTPVTALEQVMKMQKGDVTTFAEEGQHHILRLADIVPVNPKKPEASRFKVTENLKENLPLSVIDNYTDYLNKDFPVEIKDNVLNTMKSSKVGNQ